MVARPTVPFRSANAGEFSADAKGRVDIKQYYSAGLRFRNIEPVPQSGFRRMGGSWRMSRQRPPVASLSITSPTPALGPHTGTQTIWSGTVAGAVAAVFVENLYANAGVLDWWVEAETASGVWTQIGEAFSGGTSAVSRLAAFPPRAPRTATAIRIRCTFSTSATINAALAVSALQEAATAIHPRHVGLKTDAGVEFSGFVTEGICDFFTADDGWVGAARLDGVTEEMLPDLAFYAEGLTIGVFHGDLESLRMFLAGQSHEWTVDTWPYNPVPEADLGGSYTKTDDEWEISIRGIGSSPISISVTVDGETTPSITLVDAGDGVTPETGSGASTADWNLFATNIAAAINALPSIAGGVTAVYSNPATSGRLITVTFAGASTGAEYQLSAIVVNTTEVSALAYHTQIGETELEPLFSDARGWPGGVDLVQDRMAHFRLPARTGAMALSRVGEYFDFNLKGQNDAAPRLDALRSQTSETILAVRESNFLLVFTDKAVYFVTNRTIERNTPLNFQLADPTPAAPNCRPFDLEGRIYYVAMDPAPNALGGHQLVSLAYDEVAQGYMPQPESLLARHLVRDIIRTKRQNKSSDLDGTKGWMLRADGRLVAAQIIRNQEITGLCEWASADSGAIGEIGIDGNNRLWLSVARGGDIAIERYDMAIFLQDAVEATPDLAGAITGLPHANGTTVWATADGYVLGPFTVTGGAIDLGEAHTDVVVGRWIAPRFESMPQVFVTRSDEVVFRPGRIHTAEINIIDTDSIAVGANGEDPQDVTLTRAGDPVDAPPPLRTEHVTVTGLPGFMEAPTLVITQIRPGELRVRDFGIGAKL